MPARTPAAARDAYAGNLQMALSCVSNAVLRHNCFNPRPETSYFVAAPGGQEVRVRTGARGHLRLQVEFLFQLEEAPRRQLPWRAVTEKYGYQIHTDAGEEVLAFHLHAGEGGFDQPHLHLSSGAGSLRAEFHRGHVPTGPLSFAEFVEFVIRDFGVTPVRRDYMAVLAASRALSEAERGW